MLMVLPGQAQWLKEFFDVKTIVVNLAPSPFTFDNGTISLNDLPAGLSLAPTDPAPTIVHGVGDVPSMGAMSSVGSCGKTWRATTAYRPPTPAPWTQATWPA